MYNVSQVNILKFISLVPHTKYTPKDPQLTFSIFPNLTPLSWRNMFCRWQEYYVHVEKIFKKYSVLFAKSCSCSHVMW